MAEVQPLHRSSIHCSNMKEQDIYKNILVIVTGFILFSIIFDLELLILIALGIGVASIFVPKLGALVNWIWMKLALGLGWFNSRVLLSVIFYVFLFPIAMLFRVFKSNPLMLKSDKLNSFYTTRNHRYEKRDLENIW